MMNVEFVEWDEELAHFTFSLTFDELLQIKNKGSLEDGHKDKIIEAIMIAYFSD